MNDSVSIEATGPADSSSLDVFDDDWIGDEKPTIGAKAQRLLYQLDLPDDAAKVLCHDRYWTLAFLHRFLDRCDRERLRDPQAAYRMAYLSVQLASLVPLGTERGGYRDSSHGVRWQLYSRLVCASACRASGRHVEARGFFAVVAENLEAGCPWVQAQYSLRFAHLLVAEGAPQAGDEIDRALALIAKVNTERGRVATSDALLLRGVFRTLQGFPGDMTDFANVLHAADRTTENGRDRLRAGLFNLLWGTALGGEIHLEDQRDAYRLLRAVRKQMPPGRRSLRKAYLAWTEGRLLRNLGDPDASVRVLRRTRRMLLGLGMRLEVGLCTFDLAEVLSDAGRLGDLRDLFEESALGLDAPGLDDDPRVREMDRLVREAGSWESWGPATAQTLLDRAASFRSTSPTF